MPKFPNTAFISLVWCRILSSSAVGNRKHDKFFMLPEKKYLDRLSLGQSLRKVQSSTFQLPVWTTYQNLQIWSREFWSSAFSSEVHSKRQPLRCLLSIWSLLYLMLSIPVAYAELTHPGKNISLPSTPQNLRFLKSEESDLKSDFKFWPVWKRLSKISKLLCSYHQLIVQPTLAHRTSPFPSLQTSLSISENTVRSSECIIMHLDHLFNPQGIHCQKIHKQWRVSVYYFLLTISFLKYFRPFKFPQNHNVT